MALIGLRDVRDYRVRIRQDAESLGTSSPFNIKVESLTLRNFTRDEVAELYEQHTAETGQIFTPEAKALAYELTRGQPWLGNALARQAVEVLVPDPRLPIEAAHIDRAKEILIERRDTHLDSLIDRLREPRVRRIIEPILTGEFLPPDLLDDDVQFVKDLGVVLARQPYSEAAAQLVFMAYLQRIANGGGYIGREYAVGSGRIDLCVRWPHPGGVERWALELKVWRDDRSDPLVEGLDQLSGYLARLGLDRGTLILFDGRNQASPVPERCSRSELEHAGRKITLLRL